MNDGRQLAMEGNVQEVPRPMSDEGFHEVQLSGKQLVFLFMAATVVLVVIFLCGVLVGRGVRAGRSADLAAIADTSQPQIDQPTPSLSENSALAGEPAAQSGAVGGADELSYYRRLESENPQTDKLKPDTTAAPPAQAADVPSAKGAAQAASGAPASAAVESPKPTPAKTEGATQKRLPQAAKAAPAVTPASQDGLVVQVAALRDRAEAEAVVKQLAAKGYPAFLVDPAPGSPTAVYRVRVGRYKDRREAEQIVRRLEKEEQFKPWITR